LLLLVSAALYADEAEDRALKMLRRFGGEVVPARRAIGQPILCVGFSTAKVADADLNDLAGLRDLEMLSLSRTPAVTDAGLKALARLTKLKDLRLVHTGVRGAGAKELVGLHQLELLDLGGSPVTDAGLKDIAGLTRL